MLLLSGLSCATLRSLTISAIHDEQLQPLPSSTVQVSHDSPADHQVLRDMAGNPIIRLSQGARPLMVLAALLENARHRDDKVVS